MADNTGTIRIHVEPDLDDLRAGLTAAADEFRNSVTATRALATIWTIDAPAPSKPFSDTMIAMHEKFAKAGMSDETITSLMSRAAEHYFENV